MDFKYRWKNGAPPNRDRAAQDETLLDETQFETAEDHQLAENMARKQLNVPTRPADADHPVLPQALPEGN
jgi:hypothetical protein